MIKCPTCNTSNLDTSRFCDECGTRLVVAPQFAEPQPPPYVPPIQVEPAPRPVSATSVDIPAAVFAYENSQDVPQVVDERPGTAHAVLVIERGDSPGTEFRLINDDSTIGRWDADNGVFPNVDLDAFDSDAKVSRRHARIRRSNGSYYIEDLGSTNGTYLNRGRRLLPGNCEVLNDGDEVIVGKTFLRFQVMH
ncbi:MAG: FHA domain-containing protein [Chloracidobacterium sp.]|nr:FHA domain-containing protein [Chloracidobacterium sp.]